MRPGLELLDEEIGSGPPVERHQTYRMRLRMWLRRGDPVRWSETMGVAGMTLEEDGAVLVTELRVDREMLFAGLFHGVQGMRVGGMRKLLVAPHLAYGETGVPDIIPPNALLTVEVAILEPPAT